MGYEQRFFCGIRCMGKKIFVPLCACAMLFSLMGCTAAASAEASGSCREETSVRVFKYNSGYYDNYTVQKSDEAFEASGTVYMKDSRATVLQEVSVKEDADISVQGNISGIKGDIRLVYEAPDGTQTVIADGENYVFDTTVALHKGEGSILFAGSGKRESCDFDLRITCGEDISFMSMRRTEDQTESAAEPESMEASLGEPEEIPEVMEEIPELEDIYFPIVDEWPESITCVSDGMTAQPLSFPVTLEEAMEITVTCITEDGRIGMQVMDVDGKIYFDGAKMQTGDYSFTIDKAGEYKVSLYAEVWHGKLTIKPAKRKE